MTKLVLIRGLPGSGKSTYVRQKLGGFIHLEADMYFERGGKYNFDPSKLKEAHAWCQRMTRRALEAGQPVAVSNTFTQAWEIEPYLKMGQAADAEIQVVELTTQYGNIHDVPEAAIDRMKQRWDSASKITSLVDYPVEYTTV